MKQKEREGKTDRGMGQGNVSYVLLGQDWAPARGKQYWAESAPLSAERVHPVQQSKAHNETWFG